MSELKESLFCECDQYIREYSGPLSNEMRPYYLKSEADKVIAQQKYKRCLAMAERCKDNYEHQSEYDEHDAWLIITEYWERWHKRWLELAEKFKESK